ncbi:phage terminase large subunit [Novosphingobium sp.]|uniref:phage terminase large subunit n=1 Tax=Novosphingobium sp. TaxID=1874826 RepID=UPI00286DFAA5|nr:phage terminase large subunit [Novosphingobium sp.]
MNAINLTHADILACERELGRRNLADFARMAWPTLEPAAELKWGWALDSICDHLEAVSAGQSKRMLMNVPPGSMKSLLTGVILPAWEWIERPELRFLGTAHKQDLAVRDNMKCRRLIQSEWYQTRWPIALTSDQNAKTKFENSATGFREAMAFTSMTGSRGDRVVLDDPHSVDDANSPVKLYGDILTFREALPSRVNNDESAIIIIMQRLNEADVSAVAIDLGYDHLCIPMRYEEGRSKWVTGAGDPRTTDGELMFPERFPDAQVAELERTMGAYATAGQLQQRPAPRDGGLFKSSWFCTVAAMPSDIKRTVRAWDLAATAKSTSNNPDWTAGVIMSALTDGTFLIHGCRRFQGSPMEVETSLIQQTTIDGTGVTVRLAQDPGQAGKAQAEMLVRKLAGYPVKVERPTGDKATRASPLAAQAEAGNIKILVTGDPARDAWVQPFLDELCMFPAGANDDQVDAAADAFSELALGRTYRYSLDAL